MVKFNIIKKHNKVFREFNSNRRLYQIETGSNTFILRVHNHTGYGQSIGWRRVGHYNTLKEAISKVEKMEQ